MPLQPNLLERFLISQGEIPGPLLDVAVSGFQFWALIAAMEVGLFEAVAREDGEPVSTAEIARRTDCAERGIERLVQALEPLGYLRATAEGYRLTDTAEESLPIGDLAELARFFKFQMLHSEEAAQAVREAPEEGIIGWDPVRSGAVGRAYQRTMRWLASQSTEEVVGKVDLPEGADRMLDVGGSHGLYTVAFCQEYPEFEGTVLDWAIGLENARQTLEDHPDLAPRIDLLERDFLEEDLPEGIDFAFLGQIVHGLSPEENQELFRKLGRSTTEIGTVAILDQLAGISGSKFARALAALVGYNLFLFTGGRNYEYGQLKTWLQAAGFPHVSREKMQQPGFSLVIARKQPAPGWAAAVKRFVGG